MGKHKKVNCRICLRIMRSNNLKTHMKQHEKDKFDKESLYSLSIHSSRTSLKEDTESEFSVDTTNKTYEVSSINDELVI